MISHARKHDGRRPYCCEICGKTFREPSTLKAHSRVHTGDKPYTCLDCGKAFTQRAGLNYHRKASHQGLRPHVCRLCPFATAKATSLTAHYRNIHQQEPDPKVASEAPNRGADLLVTGEDNTCQAAETTPLPSFDNLKTSSISPTASPAPLTPPSSSSPSSSSSASACLEDFNPTSNTGTGFVMPSLSVSELVSHLEYGTYDYQNYRQHMYSNGPEHHQLMHHHQQEHQQQHHHQQQQQHQWFSYASNRNINNNTITNNSSSINGLVTPRIRTKTTILPTTHTSILVPMAVPTGVAMLAMAKTT